MPDRDKATSRKPKRVPDERTLVQVLSAIGVSKTDVPKLNEVTGIPVPVIIDALGHLISRGLVAEGSDAFARFYYLTEKGYKLVQRL
ncbi:MAG: hypothetical protein HYU39_01585 [Thaumarchaeota archaeon]|nr:hypothetical protein [Nitrososphaerota archaeon]